MPQQIDLGVHRLLRDCTAEPFKEVEAETFDYCQILARCGCVRALIRYATETKIKDHPIKLFLRQARYSAERLTLVPEMLAWAKHENIILTEDFLSRLQQERWISEGQKNNTKRHK